MTDRFYLQWTSVYVLHTYAVYDTVPVLDCLDPGMHIEYGLIVSLHNGKIPSFFLPDGFFLPGL